MTKKLILDKNKIIILLVLVTLSFAKQDIKGNYKYKINKAIFFKDYKLKGDKIEFDFNKNIKDLSLKSKPNFKSYILKDSKLIVDISNLGKFVKKIDFSIQIKDFQLNRLFFKTSVKLVKNKTSILINEVYLTNKRSVLELAVLKDGNLNGFSINITGRKYNEKKYIFKEKSVKKDTYIVLNKDILGFTLPKTKGIIIIKDPNNSIIDCIAYIDKPKKTYDGFGSKDFRREISYLIDNKYWQGSFSTDSLVKFKKSTKTSISRMLQKKPNSKRNFLIKSPTIGYKNK